MDSAKAEFISSNDNPAFCIRKIFVSGNVDTMKASVKSSSMRAIGSDYARYKPVVDSVIWQSIGADRSEAIVYLHLDGKVLPLPEDSIRGVVRLTVSAAVWDGTDWLASSSEMFNVRVANLAIPRPRIAGTPVCKPLNQTLSGITPIAVQIDGLRIVVPNEGVESIPEIRLFEIALAQATVRRGTFHSSDPAKDSLRNFEITEVRNDGWKLTIIGNITGPPLPKESGPHKLSISFDLVTALKHRSVIGPARSRSLTVLCTLRAK